MDPEPGKGLRSVVTTKKGENDVVLQIPSPQEPFFTNQESNDPQATTFFKNSQLGSSSADYSNAGVTEFETLTLRAQTSSSSPNKPFRVPTTESATRRKLLARSEFSKPKSRLVEPFYPNNAIVKEEKTRSVSSSSPYSRSPNNNITAVNSKGNLKSSPITPKTPLIGSPGLEGEVEEEDEEVYKTVTLEETGRKGKKWKFFILTEFAAFVCIMGLLIASLTVDRLEKSMIWGLMLWKWCVLILVIFCGRLVAERSINILVFLIERNFLLKKKVLYFVYGLKKSVQAFIWLSLVLLAWGLLFDHGVKRSRRTTKILNHITRALASCLAGAAIWLLKTFFVKLLASSFHVNRFFDRIQEAVFHQYVLRALSGPSVVEMEMAEGIGSCSTTPGRLSFKNKKDKNAVTKEEVIDVDKLKKMKHEKVSAWTMKGLINVIKGTRLTTLSGTLDQSVNEGSEQKDEEITSEWEAKAAAYRVFKKVAKPGRKYIEEADLMRFMKKEEVDNVIPLFEGTAETRKIKRSVFKKWVMVVEEMNILTTVFLRYDNQKIFYPNSVLATKPISNFYRSPEMSDAVHFVVDVSTSIETIGVLKARIKAYLESKPQHWYPSHSVQVKEIEDVNKMKMALYVNHTMNFQNSGDRGNRLSNLVLEMKKIFEELGIKYHLLPQEVHLRHVGPAAQTVLLSTR